MILLAVDRTIENKGTWGQLHTNGMSITEQFIKSDQLIDVGCVRQSVAIPYQRRMVYGKLGITACFAFIVQPVEG